MAAENLNGLRITGPRLRLLQAAADGRVVHHGTWPTVVDLLVGGDGRTGGCVGPVTLLAWHGWLTLTREQHPVLGGLLWHPSPAGRALLAQTQGR